MQADKVLWKLDCTEKPVVLVSENDTFNSIIIIVHQVQLFIKQLLIGEEKGLRFRII